METWMFQLTISFKWSKLTSLQVHINRWLSHRLILKPAHWHSTMLITCCDRRQKIILFVEGSLDLQMITDTRSPHVVLVFWLKFFLCVYQRDYGVSVLTQVRVHVNESWVFVMKRRLHRRRIIHQLKTERFDGDEIVILTYIHPINQIFLRFGLI